MILFNLIATSNQRWSSYLLYDPPNSNKQKKLPQSASVHITIFPFSYLSQHYARQFPVFFHMSDQSKQADEFNVSL